MNRDPATFESRGPAEREGMLRSIAYLRSLPETADVEDVSQSSDYRRLGIDLRWHRKDGTIVTIDSKGDEQARDTLNYALEFLSVLEEGVAGNFVTSQADEWHYHILGTPDVHIWKLQEVKQWFHSRSRVLPTFITPNWHRGRGYNTWGLLLEIKDLLVADPKLVTIKPVPLDD